MTNLLLFPWLMLWRFFNEEPLEVKRAMIYAAESLAGRRLAEYEAANLLLRFKRTRGKFRSRVYQVLSDFASQS